MQENEIGTVVSTMDSPSPSKVSFVVDSNAVIHRGQFVEMNYSEGTLIALVNNVIKTNRYFERADSVKEFESNGLSLKDQFPTTEWEFLVAETKPLGVFTETLTKRSTFPLSPGTKVRIASEKNLKKFFSFDEKGLDLGTVEYHNTEVKLNMTKLLQKHCAILAMSGAGKSYFTGVLLEELLERKKEQGRIAVIVLDVHGEYTSFCEPVTDKKSKDYSSKTKLVNARNIKIGIPKLSAGLFSSILPGLSAPQKRDLGRVIDKLQKKMKEGLGPYSLNDLRRELSKDEEVKDATEKVLGSWFAELDSLNLFSETDSPSLEDLVEPGKMTVVDLSDIINLKKKQIIVNYFANKLFFLRRQKSIPPFLLVLEEAHQFIPQNVSKEGAIARSILETIAREGRKFGASLCLISQRPIQLSTTVLSQCVVPETSILLEDGNQEKIGKLENHWKDIRIKTFDFNENKVVEQRVAGYLSQNPKKAGINSFTLITEGKRKIIATEDHPFWVKGKGWTALKEIDENNKVAVLPQKNRFEDASKEFDIVTEKEILEYLPSTISKEKTLKLLKNLSILPLSSKNKKLPILARLLGHLFGDGTLHPPYKAPNGYYGLKLTYSGKKEDLLEIQKDINRLGFKSDQKIMFDQRDSTCNFINYGSRKISGTSVYFKTGIVGLWAILMALRAPVGSKTENPTEIPEWIFKSAKNIKQEFLSSFMGSECQKIRMDGRHAERLNIPFCKTNNLLGNGVLFAEQLIGLMKEFEVDATCSKREYSKRKDGTETTQFTIAIKRNRKNIINFSKNIGYSYSRERQIQANLVAEYFQMLERCLAEKVELWKEVNNELTNNGIKAISIKHDLNPKVVQNWSSMTQQQVRLAPKENLLDYTDWFDQAAVGLGDGVIWDTVKFKFNTQVNNVRDLAIPKHHCFFANEFLTHNCNTHIILRITNPYDLKHIGESSEGMDSRALEMITVLRVGEALILGEATGFPLFFKVRKRNSIESKHEKPLEASAIEFEDNANERKKEAKQFL